jgi:hypothetical protein
MHRIAVVCIVAALLSTTGAAQNVGGGAPGGNGIWSGTVNLNPDVGAPVGPTIQGVSISVNTCTGALSIILPTGTTASGSGTSGTTSVTHTTQGGQSTTVTGNTPGPQTGVTVAPDGTQASGTSSDIKRAKTMTANLGAAGTLSSEGCFKWTFDAHGTDYTIIVCVCFAPGQADQAKVRDGS